MTAPALHPPHGSCRRVARVGDTCVRWVDLNPYRGNAPDRPHLVEVLDRRGHLLQQHATESYDVARTIFDALARGESIR